MRAIFHNLTNVVQVLFHLRGICDTEENIDLDYILLRETLKSNKSKIVMQGMSGLTNIVYNSGKKYWEMLSVIEKNQTVKAVLGLYNSTKPFPVGVNKWFLKGNCNANPEDFEVTTLKFAKVS